jgi:hypothetical protein
MDATIKNKILAAAAIIGITVLLMLAAFTALDARRTPLRDPDKPWTLRDTVVEKAETREVK